LVSAISRPVAVDAPSLAARNTGSRSSSELPATNRSPSCSNARVSLASVRLKVSITRHCASPLAYNRT